MEKQDIDAAHKHFAVECFNLAWDLIDLEERGPQQNREMIRLAETSYWHWGRVSDKTDTNLSVGLWQLARVYALAGIPSTAQAYAEKCRSLSISASLPPFYVAYAFEALARAAQVAGTNPQPHLESAREWAEKVDDAESRAMVLKDLESLT